AHRRQRSTAGVEGIGRHLHAGRSQRADHPPRERPARRRGRGGADHRLVDAVGAQPDTTRRNPKQFDAPRQGRNNRRSPAVAFESFGGNQPMRLTTLLLAVLLSIGIIGSTATYASPAPSGG